MARRCLSRRPHQGTEGPLRHGTRRHPQRRKKTHRPVEPDKVRAVPGPFADPSSHRVL